MPANRQDISNTPMKSLQPVGGDMNVSPINAMGLPPLQAAPAAQVSFSLVANMSPSQ